MRPREKERRKERKKTDSEGKADTQTDRERLDLSDRERQMNCEPAASICTQHTIGPDQWRKPEANEYRAKAWLSGVRKHWGEPIVDSLFGMVRRPQAKLHKITLNRKRLLCYTNRKLTQIEQGSPPPHCEQPPHGLWSDCQTQPKLPRAGGATHAFSVGAVCRGACMHHAVNADC